MEEKKIKEKGLTGDGRISVRAKTIDVSTEQIANPEVNENGELTKASYTVEGNKLLR